MKRAFFRAKRIAFQTRTKSVTCKNRACSNTGKGISSWKRYWTLKKENNRAKEMGKSWTGGDLKRHENMIKYESTSRHKHSGKNDIMSTPMRPFKNRGANEIEQTSCYLTHFTIRWEIYRVYCTLWSIACGFTCNQLLWFHSNVPTHLLLTLCDSQS